MNNLDYVNQERGNLPDEKLQQIQKMEELGVDPKKIEIFRQSEIEKHEKNLENSYLRTKIETPTLILNKFGIKVYTDQYVTKNFKKGYYHNKVDKLLMKLVQDYKDVLPNRKPKIVITDTGKNPISKDAAILGNGETPPGVYYNRLIYIDQKWVNNFKIFIHEYAHFLSDRISKQTEPILLREYRNMLNEYFLSIQKSKTKRKNLEGLNNEVHRMQMAAKLGLPTDYSSTNFDEWFAELIANWKNMPNNKHTYRFKQILKKILVRI